MKIYKLKKTKAVLSIRNLILVKNNPELLYLKNKKIFFLGSQYCVKKIWVNLPRNKNLYMILIVKVVLKTPKDRTHHLNTFLTIQMIIMAKINPIKIRNTHKKHLNNPSSSLDQVLLRKEAKNVILKAHRNMQVRGNKIISKVSLIIDLLKNQKELQMWLNNMINKSILMIYNTINPIREMLMITIFNPICKDPSNTTIVRLRCTKCSMAQSMTTTLVLLPDQKRRWAMVRTNWISIWKI